MWKEERCWKPCPGEEITLGANLIDYQYLMPPLFLGKLQNGGYVLGCMIQEPLLYEPYIYFNADVGVTEFINSFICATNRIVLTKHEQDNPITGKLKDELDRILDDKQ